MASSSHSTGPIYRPNARASFFSLPLLASPARPTAEITVWTLTLPISSKSLGRTKSINPPTNEAPSFCLSQSHRVRHRSVRLLKAGGSAQVATGKRVRPTGIALRDYEDLALRSRVLQEGIVAKADINPSIVRHTEKKATFETRITSTSREPGRTRRIRLNLRRRKRNLQYARTRSLADSRHRPGLGAPSPATSASSLNQSLKGELTSGPNAYAEIRFVANR